MSFDGFGIDRKLVDELWRAVQKVAALAVLILVHWGLQKLLGLSFGDLPEYGKVGQLATAAALLVFMLIYGRLLFEMVTIFLPLPNSSRSNGQETAQK